MVESIEYLRSSSGGSRSHYSISMCRHEIDTEIKQVGSLLEDAQRCQALFLSIVTKPRVQFNACEDLKNAHSCPQTPKTNLSEGPHAKGQKGNKTELHTVGKQAYTCQGNIQTHTN